MKLSAREWNLLTLTAVIVFGVSGYLLAESALAAREDVRQRIEEIDGNIARRGAVLAQSDQWETRLRDLRESLPSYPEDQDVTSRLLNLLEQAAVRHDLQLLRRDPERERQDGELYELTINCRWRGDLDALVLFLFDLQQQGVQLGVRQLSITPRGPGRLEGTMTIDGAYSRHPPDQTETADSASAVKPMGDSAS